MTPHCPLSLFFTGRGGKAPLSHACCENQQASSPKGSRWPRRIRVLTRPAVSIPSAAAPLVGALALIAGLAASWGPVAKPPGAFDVADHPVAVLAWAKLNCYDELALRPGAPKTHPEILLQVSGTYEAARSKRKIAVLCAEAMAIARPVTNTGSLPEVTGASPLYERLATAAR